MSETNTPEGSPSTSSIPAKPIDHEGILNASLKKKLGRHHYKHWYFVVSGGTAHLYKTQQAETPSHSIPLSGAKFSDLKVPQYAFVVQTGEQELAIATVGEEERNTWKGVLLNAGGQAPSSPPLRQARALKRRDSLGSRGMKKLSSKAATSSAGKALLRKYATDEAMELLAALKQVVKSGLGKKSAKDFENNVIKIAVKAYMKLEKKELTGADFEPLDPAMRRCFTSVDRLFLLEKDSRSRARLREQIAALLSADEQESEQVVDARRAKEEEALNTIVAALTEMREKLSTVMANHMTLKNQHRILEAFAVFNQDFLRNLFRNEEMEPHIETLNSAMLSYTSVL